MSNVWKICTEWDVCRECTDICLECADASLDAEECKSVTKWCKLNYNKKDPIKGLF
jgi:hypothetical protein